jgi:ketosteroid isomerase-like protein
MRKWLVVSLLLTTMSTQQAAVDAAVMRLDRAALVQQVYAAERAFAKTMADRDFAAFARHVAADTVFFDGAQPLVGKAAVLAGWKDLYKSGPAPFAWDPDQVVVLDSGDLALSTGKVTDASGKVLARFNSIWRRQRNGQWQVVFDKGSPVCAPPPPAAGS